ncbi:MAG: hypothetical protein HYY03_04965 [Chloroflexi bacterium]|nr:hypothetical protein [Chloroflexota bacterium]
MEVVLFMLGSLLFLGGLVVCLARVFAPGEREKAGEAPAVSEPSAEGPTAKAA